jgi:hypothetical protein
VNTKNTNGIYFINKREMHRYL